MATLEQEQNEKNSPLSHLSDLDKIKPQGLVRTDELGRELRERVRTSLICFS